MLQEWQQATVIKIEDETFNTKRFFLQTKNEAPFDFNPGQFVTLDLPIHEQKNKRWRSYSIASAPNGTNIFELIIVLVEDGLGTPYLFNEINVGSELTFRGAAGVFVLHEPIEHDLFLICTGTGIAPFRSMIHFIKNKSVMHKNIYLLFGTRTQQDVLYNKEMLALEKEVDGFYFIPVLSRENWEGKKGYVHDVYKELAYNKPDANFMLCGWKNMIDDARKNLAELGYDKKQIHFELYG